MNNTKLSLQTLFQNHGGILSKAELQREGISYYRIKQFMEIGLIERIHRGLYKWKDGDQYSQWLEVQKLIPKGGLLLVFGRSSP